MKCCMSTDVGTWTNWLTFEPGPDYSPDATTGLLPPTSYKRCYAEFYDRENPTYTYWPLQRGVVLTSDVNKDNNSGFNMVLFSKPSKHLCRRYMRSTECPASLSFYSLKWWNDFKMTFDYSWVLHVLKNSVNGSDARTSVPAAVFWLLFLFILQFRAFTRLWLAALVREVRVSVGVTCYTSVQTATEYCWQLFIIHNY